MVSTHVATSGEKLDDNYLGEPRAYSDESLQHLKDGNRSSPTAELTQPSPSQENTYGPRATFGDNAESSDTWPQTSTSSDPLQPSGSENTADIWGESMGGGLQGYNSPEPFSAQVTGRSDPMSSPERMYLQSNNPFLKSKSKQNNTYAPDQLESHPPPIDYLRKAPHDQGPHDENQVNTGMAALAISPSAKQTDYVSNSETWNASDDAKFTGAISNPHKSQQTKEMVSPTDSENLIQLDSREASIDEGTRSQVNTPTESDIDNTDRAESRGLEHQDFSSTHRAADPQSIPSIVEPSPTIGPGNNIAEHASHRSEIYDIRIVNWTDGTTELRQSPVLVQNENGPCPLLALVNCLVIRSPINAKTPLIRALHSRERISLGLLIQALFDELVSSQHGDEQLPDIEALSVFLTMLHTGMNVNPRLTPVLHPPTPGTFLKTRDIELYSAFHLPLVHGWAATPGSPSHEAMIRVAEYHDDIQLLHFQREDLEERAIRNGSLTPDEERLFKDIDTIQRFTTIDNPTQLSPFGLQHLGNSLPPAGICVLFRNDHFSTLFKHPKSGQLFTLVTDAGYASHAEIVWESLVDVNGTNSELYSGDFRSVGHGPSAVTELPPPPSRPPGSAPGDAASVAEQTDADYAFALSLQYEDEQSQRQRTASAPTNTSRNASGTHPETTSSRGRSNHQIRNTRSANFTRPVSALPSTLTPIPRTPTTNRPPPSRTQGPPPRRTEDDPDAPPPTYEQAAQEPAYVPPASGIPPQQRHPGQAALYNQMPGYSPGHVPSSNMSARRRPGPASLSSSSLPQRDYYRERDRNRDCIVM